MLTLSELEDPLVESVDGAVQTPFSEYILGVCWDNLTRGATLSWRLFSEHTRACLGPLHWAYLERAFTRFVSVRPDQLGRSPRTGKRGYSFAFYRPGVRMEL